MPALAVVALLLAVVTVVFSLNIPRSATAFGLNGSASSQATPAPSQPAAPIVVNWTTKSEVNTAGFNLYRAESAGGPFAQINQALIPAANDPITGGSYVFTDTNVVAGVSYYYQLEDVDLNGTRTRYEKLIMVTASAPTAGVLGIPIPIALTGIAGLSFIALGIMVWRARHQ